MGYTPEDIRAIFRGEEPRTVVQPPKTLDSIAELLQGPLGILDRYSPSELAEMVEDPIMEDIREAFRVLPRHK